MSTVTFERKGKTWVWPADDVKCRAAVFDELPAIRLALKHVRNQRTAIQAGGNMGVFPHALAPLFKQVITAEPDPRCFECLVQNVKDSNVHILNAAFTQTRTRVRMEDVGEGNLGAQRVSFLTLGNVPGIPIDSIGVTDCDLIYLDIEGMEMAALRGAEGTIEVSLPLICVEDKGLSEHFGSPKGAIGKWLAERFGYRQVATFKRDVMYACASPPS